MFFLCYIDIRYNDKMSTDTYIWKVFWKNPFCKHKIDGIVYTKTNSSQIYQKPSTESEINKGCQYKKKIKLILLNFYLILVRISI